MIHIEREMKRKFNAHDVYYYHVSSKQVIESRLTACQQSVRANIP